MIGVFVAGAVVLAGFALTFSGVTVRGRLPGLVLMAGGALLSLSVGWPAGAQPWWTLLVAAITLAGMLAVAAWVARSRSLRGDERDRERAGADSLDDERP